MAEMTIEGLREFEMVRDYLYTRMRGVRPAAPDSPRADSPASMAPQHPPGTDGDLAAALNEVTRELAAVREILASLLARRDR